MAFSYISKKLQDRVYYLHGKDVCLAGNRLQRIYYFAAIINDLFALDSIPVGYETFENPRTGLPMLRRVKTL